jgi:hypothetical protein
MNTRIITAVIIALGALAAFFTLPQARSESVRLAQVGDVRQEDRSADSTERKQKVERADRSGAERGERSGYGDSERH